MSTEWVAELFTCLFVGFFGLFVGICAGLYVSGSGMKEDCAKQHNVYKCKLVAVPVEGGE